MELVPNPGHKRVRPLSVDEDAPAFKAPFPARPPTLHTSHTGFKDSPAQWDAPPRFDAVSPPTLTTAAPSPPAIPPNMNKLPLALVLGPSGGAGAGALGVCSPRKAGQGWSPAGRSPPSPRDGAFHVSSLSPIPREGGGEAMMLCSQPDNDPA